MRHCKFWGWVGTHRLLWKNKTVSRRSAMERLDRALISSYRISVITMPLTEAVWPQFMVQIFGMQLVSSFGDSGRS